MSCWIDIHPRPDNVTWYASGLDLGAPFINDLPLILQGVNFVLCTDDTNILVDYKAETFQHKIAFLMQHLEICFHNNDLIVDIEKACVISFHSHQNRHPFRPHVMFNRNAIAYI